MNIKYSKSDTEKICTSCEAARKFFGGDMKMAVSLMARINMIQAAVNMDDIAAQKQLNYHPLIKKGRHDYRGWYAIDVSSHHKPWRIILRPITLGNKTIIEVNAVEIMEISKHYE